jgi:serine protease Do
VVVEQVDSTGPARRAGLQPGDVVIQAGDVAVASSLDLYRAVLERRDGDRIPLLVRRYTPGKGGSPSASGGPGDYTEQKTELVVETAAKSPTEHGESRGGDVAWRKLGLRLQAVGAEAVTRTHPQLHGGMLVLDVLTGSSADRGGLQRGDILLGLHQWEMLSADNLRYVLEHPDLATFTPLRFFILRQGQVHRGWLPLD